MLWLSRKDVKKDLYRGIHIRLIRFMDSIELSPNPEAPIPSRSRSVQVDTSHINYAIKIPIHFTEASALPGSRNGQAMSLLPGTTTFVHLFLSNAYHESTCRVQHAWDYLKQECTIHVLVEKTIVNSNCFSTLSEVYTNPRLHRVCKSVSFGPVLSKACHSTLAMAFSVATPPSHLQSVTLQILEIFVLLLRHRQFASPSFLFLSQTRVCFL
jgi:hypothetical protein